LPRAALAGAGGSGASGEACHPLLHFGDELADFFVVFLLVGVFKVLEPGLHSSSHFLTLAGTLSASAWSSAILRAGFLLGPYGGGDDRQYQQSCDEFFRHFLLLSKRFRYSRRHWICLLIPDRDPDAEIGLTYFKSHQRVFLLQPNPDTPFQRLSGHIWSIASMYTGIKRYFQESGRTDVSIIESLRDAV
jgi:hypothetical protein